MLPKCIVQLIESFLEKRKKERRPCMHKSFSFSYMSIADWQDTEDVRAYGDY